MGAYAHRTFRANERHGVSHIFDSKGRKRQVERYRQGMKDGVWQRFDEPGHLIEEATYKDDKLNGPFTQWFFQLQD